LKTSQILFIKWIVEPKVVSSTFGMLHIGVKEQKKKTTWKNFVEIVLNEE
jgi:hypothetical protein